MSERKFRISNWGHIVRIPCKQGMAVINKGQTVYSDDPAFAAACAEWPHVEVEEMEKPIEEMSKAEMLEFAKTHGIEHIKPGMKKAQIRSELAEISG